MTIGGGSPAGVLTLDSGFAGSTASISVTVGQHTISAPVVLNQGVGIGIMTTAAGTGLTISGPISDGGRTNGISLSGGGTLTLAGANTYSGGTLFYGGVLNINSDAALGAVPSVPTTNIFFDVNTGPPTLQFGTNYTGTSLSTNRSIAIGSNDLGFVDTNGNPLITYAGSITADYNGTFGKTGAGTFELDTSPYFAFFGGFEVAGGTLRLNYGTSAGINSNVAAIVTAGGTLELAGSVSQLGGEINVMNYSTAAAGLLVSSNVHQQVRSVTGTGNVVINAGSNLTAYQIIQNSLTIHGTGTTAAMAGSVTLVPSGSGSTANPTGPNNISYSNTLAALTIDNNGAPLGSRVYYGTLDIGNNGLVIAYGSGADPYAQIDDMIRSGFDGAHWDGTGISSSLARAAANSQTPLNIGLVDFTPGLNGDGTFIVFQGQTVTTNALLLRLTYMDDILLSGDMSAQNAASDALLFAANYGSGTTWSVGDLTHDGQINSADALLFAANYAVGLPSLYGTTGNAVATESSLAAVPEPSGAMLAVIGMAGAGLLARRRRAQIQSVSETPI